MHPKISVIIPVYNAERYIERCVDSVINQSFEDLEILIIDDGSNDRSGAVCDNYAQKENRVRVYHKQNGGASSARNLGLDKAQGEWIIFVDSDDWIDTDYCKNLISASSSSKSLVMTRHAFIGKRIDSIEECRDLSGEERVDFIINNRILDYSGPYCKLFNREVLQKNNIRFPEQVHVGEDGIFMARYLNATVFLTVLNINDYHYEDNCQSVSHKLYDFESEWECFYIWKSELIKLFNQKNWKYETLLKYFLWNNRIGDTFMRCVLCLSRQEKKLSAKQIYNSLNSIPRNEIEEFSTYYEPTTWQRRLVKKVFGLHNLVIAFFLVKIDQCVNRSKLR